MSILFQLVIHECFNYIIFILTLGALVILFGSFYKMDTYLMINYAQYFLIFQLASTYTFWSVFA
jgi:hypothetical protein